jgi:hypothetical protein
MVKLTTTILPKGTCLVRGENLGMNAHPHRFFGYFGTENTIDKFCRSKAFVKKYARNEKYEYWIVKKDIVLVDILYIALELYDDEDVLFMLKDVQEIISFVNDNPVDKVLDMDRLRIMRNIADFYIPDIEDPVYRKEYQKILAIRDSLPKTADNPDYTMAVLLCYMGYNGWMRVGDKNNFTDGDEIFICNIHQLVKDGYMEMDEKCNLSDC